MKYKKIDEVLDSADNLIGHSDEPGKGGELESQAGNTTDYNAKISRQPYRYDMLGRFGFTLFPFFEGTEDDSKNELLDDLAKLMYEKYIEIIKYYFKNPNKLKPDYRKASKENFETQDGEKKNHDYEWAKKIIRVIEPHIEKSLEGVQQNLDENIVFEDRVMREKTNKWIGEKEKDKDVLDKDIKRVVGFLNKLDKEDLNKVIDLLEV